MQEYREYLKYNLKYVGIWNIMEYNAHIPNIVDDFASDGPLDSAWQCCFCDGRNDSFTTGLGRVCLSAHCLNVNTFSCIIDINYYSP